MFRTGWVLKIASFALLTLLATVPAVLRAQEITDDRLVAAVPYRPVEDIRGELDQAAISIKLAQNKRAAAQTTLGAVKTRIEAKKKEIDEISNQVKTAKNADDKARVVALEANKKAAERTLDLLETRKDLREAELELAQANVEVTEANQYILQLELELALKRMEVDSLMGSGTTTLAGRTAFQAARSIEEKLLKSQKETASKKEALSSKERKVVEQRMKLFKKQRELLHGGTGIENPAASEAVALSLT